MPWVHLLLNNVGCLLGSQINKRILWPDSPVALMECIRPDPLSPITVLIKEPEIPWCGHICLCSPAERTPCISLTVSHYRSIWAPQASASDGKTLKNHSRARSHTDLNINCHSSGQKRCTLSPAEMPGGNAASPRSVRGHASMRQENEERRKVRAREREPGLRDCDSLSSVSDPNRSEGENDSQPFENGSTFLSPGAPRQCTSLCFLWPFSSGRNYYLWVIN